MSERRGFAAALFFLCYNLYMEALNERIVVIYHGSCPDGFGGAYSAWKKFGDTAEYIPISYGNPKPEGLADAHVYFIDCCYEKDVMDGIVAEAAHVTVLDHHEGTEAVVKTIPEFVYDANRSGTTIAWQYFHPDIPTPQLLKYVEDDDLFRFTLPDTKAVLSYIAIRPYVFEDWDALVTELEDPQSREAFLIKARTYAEYFQLLAEQAADHVKFVKFEGYEVGFANAHPHKTMKSRVGNLLAKKYPPFALVVSAHPKGYGISIRGDGSVDVSEIARKYGGNGHPNSSGFVIPADGKMPWELIEKDETPGD
jgi:oligoribonuclease NrnB/cAMP/cGMP phosphodiesterase (DHH superfamily)